MNSKSIVNQLLFLSVLAAVIVCTQGCEKQRKYQILNFFFTGVTPVEDKKSTPPERKSQPVPKVKIQTPARMPGPVFYAHAPYAKRRCDACHVALDFAGRSSGIRYASGRRGNGADALSPGHLSAPIETLCIQCHDSMSAFIIGTEGLWLHGPAAQGKCTFCHAPHQSNHPNLLIEKSETVCGQCHMGNFISKTTGHSESSECLNCHNPHVGKTRLLLKNHYREEAGPESQAAP